MADRRTMAGRQISGYKREATCRYTQCRPTEADIQRSMHVGTGMQKGKLCRNPD